MIELNRLTSVFAICLVIFATLTVNGQTEINSSPSAKLPVPIKIAREGWTIPAFADKKAKVSLDRMEIIDDVDIQINISKFPEEKLI